MYSRVVRRLKHDAGVGRVHLVDWQRSVSSNDIAATTLLPHPISHKECLIRLL